MKLKRTAAEDGRIKFKWVREGSNILSREGLRLSKLQGRLILPNTTGVILRAGNDGVALIVEGACKDFVFMAFEHLQLVAILS